jgi:glutamate/tyrosine decarboxylase-like PLP-dependent enzyme
MNIPIHHFNQFNQFRRTVSRRGSDDPLSFAESFQTIEPLNNRTIVTIAPTATIATIETIATIATIATTETSLPTPAAPFHADSHR